MGVVERSVRINYDEGPNGNYLLEADRIADELIADGKQNVRVIDTGNGADVIYSDG